MTPVRAQLFEIVLYQPQIAPNTGNIMRLCVNAPARLHLIEPMGFVLDDRRLRRAGMDYREYANVQRHRTLAECREFLGDRRWLAFSSRARTRLSAWSFSAGDVLMFGSETAGLPPEVMNGVPEAQRLLIPQMDGARSLNLANAVAVGLYEAWRQLDFAGAVRRSPA